MFLPTPRRGNKHFDSKYQPLPQAAGRWRLISCASGDFTHALVHAHAHARLGRPRWLVVSAPTAPVPMLLQPPAHVGARQRQSPRKAAEVGERETERKR